MTWQMSKHVAAIHTQTHTQTHTHTLSLCLSLLVLPTVRCVIMTWNATNRTTNLKSTIHTAFPSFSLHCLLTSDGQWRIGTNGNDVISIRYKEMQLQLCPSHRDRLANTVPRMNIFVTFATKYTIYSTFHRKLSAVVTNSLLQAKLSAPKCNKTHLQQHRASNSQFCPQSVCAAVRNVSPSASTHLCTNKQSTMTYRHNKAMQSSSVQISLYIPVPITCTLF